MQDTIWTDRSLVTITYKTGVVRTYAGQLDHDLIRLCVKAIKAKRAACVDVRLTGTAPYTLTLQ